MMMAAWSLFGNRAASSAEPLTRFAIALGDSQGLTGTVGRRVAFSPNGREFVYVGPGKGGGQLWLRAIGALDATPIPGSDGATNRGAANAGQAA